MKKRRAYIYLTLSALLATVCLGTLVWMVIMLGNENEALQTAQILKKEQTSKDVFTASVQSLARDTLEQRNALKNLTADASAVEALEMIEAAGETARVSVSIDSVGSGNEEGVFERITVSMRAEGSFSRLIHFVSLLDTLPIPAYVEQYGIDKTESGGWQIRVREHMLLEKAS